MGMPGSESVCVCMCARVCVVCVCMCVQMYACVHYSRHNYLTPVLVSTAVWYDDVDLATCTADQPVTCF